MSTISIQIKRFCFIFFNCSLSIVFAKWWWSVDKSFLSRISPGSPTIALQTETLNTTKVEKETKRSDSLWRTCTSNFKRLDNICHGVRTGLSTLQDHKTNLPSRPPARRAWSALKRKGDEVVPTKKWRWGCRHQRGRCLDRFHREKEKTTYKGSEWNQIEKLHHQLSFKTMFYSWC